MNDLDIVSILVAAAFGAVLLYVVDQLVEGCPTCSVSGFPSTNMIITGLAVGAGVQIGVRLIGVS